MPEEVRTCTCSGCGASLPDEPRGPCPSCGDTRRTISLHLQGEVTARASMSATRTRTYLQKNPQMIFGAFLLTVGPPFLGLYLAAWPGALIGLGCAIACDFVGYLAITRVIERDHYHDL